MSLQAPPTSRRAGLGRGLTSRPVRGVFALPALRTAARAAAPALGLYLAIRLAVLAVLAIFAHLVRIDLASLPGLLSAHDGSWFRAIAEHGYDTAIRYRPDGTLVNTNVAFFPGYPFLVRGVAAVFGLAALSAGLLTSLVASLAAAWGIFAVGDLLHGRRAGVLLAGLWAVQPHGIVQWMGYSESLFTALVAWSLYALLRARWLTTGVLCLLAGLTRAQAAPLVLAVVAAAIVALLRRRAGWRPAAAAALAPLGLVGYLAWVGVALHRPDGYFWMQRVGWHTRFDGGLDTLRTLLTVATRPMAFEWYAVTAVVLAALVLAVLLVRDRPPWPVLVFVVGSLLLVLTAAGYYHSKARFLLPVFPLLLPAAAGLAAARRSTVVVLLGAGTLAAGWFAGYLLITWPFSP